MQQAIKFLVGFVPQALKLRPSCTNALFCCHARLGSHHGSTDQNGESNLSCQIDIAVRGRLFSWTFPGPL
jgi:hypothetical protein